MEVVGVVYVGQYYCSAESSSLFGHTSNNENYLADDADEDIRSIMLSTARHNYLHWGNYTPSVSEWCHACKQFPVTEQSEHNFTTRILIRKKEVTLALSEQLCSSCLQLHIAHELKVWGLLREALTRIPAEQDVTFQKVENFLEEVKVSIDRRWDHAFVCLKPAKQTDMGHHIFRTAN